MKTTMKATDLLRKDHEKVKELFERFENSDNAEERSEIIAEIAAELRIHSTLEEEIFYPLVKRKLHKEEMVRHSLEEHQDVEDLLQEIEDYAPEDDQYEEIFQTLVESVNHHIKEEESQMFPEVEKAADIDFEQVAKEMENRKKELKKEYS